MALCDVDRPESRRTSARTGCKDLTKATRGVFSDLRSDDTSARRVTCKRFRVNPWEGAGPARRRNGAYFSYLNDTFTRARKAVTFPFSIVTSSRVTSATRRSRRLLAAVWTAFLAASSHEVLLVPTSSVTR